MFCQLQLAQCTLLANIICHNAFEATQKKVGGKAKGAVKPILISSKLGLHAPFVSTTNNHAGQTSTDSTNAGQNCILQSMAQHPHFPELSPEALTKLAELERLLEAHQIKKAHVCSKALLQLIPANHVLVAACTFFFASVGHPTTANTPRTGKELSGVLINHPSKHWLVVAAQCALPDKIPFTKLQQRCRLLRETKPHWSYSYYFSGLFFSNPQLSLNYKRLAKALALSPENEAALKSRAVNLMMDLWLQEATRAFADLETRKSPSLEHKLSEAGGYLLIHRSGDSKMVLQSLLAQTDISKRQRKNAQRALAYIKRFERNPATNWQKLLRAFTVQNADRVAMTATTTVLLLIALAMPLNWLLDGMSDSSVAIVKAVGQKRPIIIVCWLAAAVALGTILLRRNRKNLVIVRTEYPYGGLIYAILALLTGLWLVLGWWQIPVVWTLLGAAFFGIRYLKKKAAMTSK